MTKWQGWAAPHGSSPYIDLSQPIAASGHAVAYFDQPQIRKIASIPDKPFNVTELTTYCHFGTHVDAPCHFIGDGPSIEQIPLDRFIGRALVVQVSAVSDEEIPLAKLLAAGADALQGDMLLVDTGWAQYYGTDPYVRHPYFAPDVAGWIHQRGVKLLGMDTLGPDLPIPLRQSDFTWPLHGALLSQGVIIAENLTGLTPLVGQHVEVIAAPLNIVGSDGGPARILARRLEA